MKTTASSSRPAGFDPRMVGSSSRSPEPPGWDLATERRIDDGQTISRLMGWFSIGLGAAEVLAARRIASTLGMKESAPIFRLYGIREIVQGIGVLRNRRRPRRWMMVRIAGDVLDLATLGAGLGPKNKRNGAVVVAIGAVAGAMAMDIVGVRQLARARRDHSERGLKDPSRKGGGKR